MRQDSRSTIGAAAVDLAADPHSEHAMDRERGQEGRYTGPAARNA